MIVLLNCSCWWRWWWINHFVVLRSILEANWKVLFSFLPHHLFRVGCPIRSLNVAYRSSEARSNNCLLSDTSNEGMGIQIIFFFRMLPRNWAPWPPFDIPTGCWRSSFFLWTAFRGPDSRHTPLLRSHAVLEQPLFLRLQTRQPIGLRSCGLSKSAPIHVWLACSGTYTA